MNLLNINIILVLILFSISLHTQEADLILKTKAYDLAEDKEGNIWVGTTQGVFKINPNDFSYKKFTTQNGLPNNDIWDLEEAGGKIWCITKSKYQGYIKNDSAYFFIVPEKKSIHPIFNYTTEDRIVYHSNHGTSRNHQLIELKNNKWEIHPRSDSLARQGHIIYNPFNKGFIYIYDTLISLYPLIYNKKIIYNSKLFNKDFRLGYGGRKNIYFINNKNGLLLINTIKQKVKYFLRTTYTEKGVKVSVPNSLVNVCYDGNFIVLDENFNEISRSNFTDYQPNHILLDRNQNIWIANEEGVYYIPSSKLSTKYYLKGKSILHLDTLNQNIYSSTKNEIFNYHNVNKNFINYYKYKSSNVINPVKFLSNFDKLSSISYKTGVREVRQYYMIRDFIKTKQLELISANRHLSIKNKLNGKLIRKNYVGLNKFIIYDTNIYITTNEGLYKIVNDTNLQKVNLDGVGIRDIINHHDKLLIGTDGFGFYLFDGDTAKQVPILTDAIVNQIKIYDDKVWLATNQGIKVLDIDFQNPENSKIINSFIEEDGLKVNYSNCLLLYDSNLYVGCESGISVLDLRNSYYYQKPKISFDTRFIKQQNKLPIEFEFHSHKPMTYFYSLDNQKSWTKIEGKRFQINDLDKENTKISFKAINHHQIENIVDYQIKVKFEWWQKTSWQIVLGIAGSILLYLFFRLGYNISQKRTQKRIELRHQLNNLKLEALRSQMNPHFVNNALNSILYLIQEKDAGFAEKYLIKFARLMRLYFNFSSTEFITIQEELEVINTYISIEKLRFEDKFDFKIDIDENIDTESEEIPSLITQPFIENAINHGIFHIKHKGLIKLSFKRLEDESLCISIWDNGIGYLKSLDKKEKDDEKHSSKTITDRIETLNNIQKYNVESSIHDHGNGTEIKILIKE